MVFQAEDRTRAKKQQADAAIQMALRGQWEQAVDVNRSILESFPADVDACNRLGKALTELGRYADARDSYMKAMEIDPLNLIARKNLNRLATLGKAAPKKAKKTASQKLSPEMFIEETGKTTITALEAPDMEVANRLTAGDLVKLVRDKKANLFVETLGGEHVGDLEAKLGQRLVKLMEGGNEYVAAVSGLTEDGVRIFIRETVQAAAQAGKVSFPGSVTETVRPYVKSRLVRSDEDVSSREETEEEEDDAIDDSDDDDGSDAVDEGTISARSRGKLPGADGDDEDE